MTVLPSFFMQKYNQREGWWCFQMKFLKKFLPEKSYSPWTCQRSRLSYTQ
nr:MAG TPA: hypothetical protein [Caudoviricetes sp.]